MLKINSHIANNTASSLFYAQKDTAHMAEMLKIALTYKGHIGGLPEGVVSIMSSAVDSLAFLQNRLKNAEESVRLLSSLSEEK